MGKPSLPPAAYAKEAEDRATEILKEPVEQLFFKLWGKSWPEKVREKMSAVDEAWKKTNSKFSGRSKLVIDADGKGHFDLQTLMHALRDNAAKLPGLSAHARKIDKLCDAVNRYRNSQSHKKDLSVRNELQTAIVQIERLIDLVEIIVGEKGVKELKIFLNDFVSEDLPDPLKPGDTTALQSAEQWQAILDLQEMVKQLLDRAPSPPSSALPAVEEIESPKTEKPPTRRSLNRRSTAIPGPRKGVVVFPTVAEGPDADDHGELCYFSSTIYDPGKRERFLALINGFDKPDLFEQIVDGARGAEADAARSTLHTRTRVDPGDSVGTSWGLAAVLADKSARYDWSDDAKDRMVIATGVITPRNSIVQPIDSFHEKLKLLGREAPDGAIFIFPAPNTGTSNSPDQPVMDRLKKRGIRLIPVNDIADLDHLFALSEPADSHYLGAGAIDSPAPARPSASASNEPAPVPITIPPDSSGPHPKQRTIMKSVASAGVAAVVLLGGTYGIATYLERDRIPPEQAQKIADLVHTQAGKQASAMSPQECNDLISAARGANGIDARRLDQRASQAFMNASACAKRIQASDVKLARLVDAGHQVTGSGADLEGCSTLATAVATLDPFDNGRLEDFHKRAASTADICRPVLLESDRRLAEFSRRVSAVTEADLSGCDALVTTGNQLSQPDLQRLRGRSRDEFDKLSACTTRLQASDARIAELSNAADLFDPTDPNSATALVAARSNLQSADVARIDPGKKDRIQGILGRASASLKESDSRIAAFVAAFREWQRNPTRASAIAFDRSAQLSVFDRKRMTSSDTHDAQSALSGMRDTLRGQADRWQRVEQQAASAERLTPADYQRPLERAVGALTQADKEAATARERQILERAIWLLKQGNRIAPPGEDFGIIPGAPPDPNSTRNSASGDGFATVPRK